MKTITLHQPWASLIAYGHKRFETRGWRTHYRGPIAIHAGKQIDRQAVLMIARDYPSIWREISPLPTGVILATAELVECWEITENRSLRLEGIMRAVPLSEEYFGDYSPGRYAWELADVRQLTEPIPAKGQLSLWEYPLEYVKGGDADRA